MLHDVHIQQHQVQTRRRHFYLQVFRSVHRNPDTVRHGFQLFQISLKKRVITVNQTGMMLHLPSFPPVIKTTVRHFIDFHSQPNKQVHRLPTHFTVGKIEINVSKFTQKRFLIQLSDSLSFLQNRNNPFFHKEMIKPFQSFIHPAVSLLNLLYCHHPFHKNDIRWKQFFGKPAYSSIYQSRYRLLTCDAQKSSPVLFRQRKTR